jgi:hypothetical protein
MSPPPAARPVLSPALSGLATVNRAGRGWRWQWSALTALILIGLAMLPPAQAATVTPSAFTPSQDDTPILELRVDGEQHQLSRADIETLGLHEFDMQHFEGPQGRFAGVWLDDLLRDQGLDEHPRLRFIAHDDYTTFLTPAERQEKRYLLVTRLDGEPLTRDTLGPTLLAVPADVDAVLAGRQPMTRWIWSIHSLHAQ